QTFLYPTSTLFPYTTLFRSAGDLECHPVTQAFVGKIGDQIAEPVDVQHLAADRVAVSDRLRQLHLNGIADLRAELLKHNARRQRSEEHTSELQSRENLVCRL